MRKKGLEPHLLGGGGGAGKQRGRELRHHIKAPSWLQEALTGRVLSGGGRGPLCHVEIKIGRGWGGAPTHGEASLASLGEMLCDSGGRKRWLEQLMVPEERGLGSCQP